MKKRKLGEIEVSAVGMGCMAFFHGYGKIPPEQYSIEAIQMAYEHGCTFFDTAEIYSPNLSGIGHNECIVGKALHDVRENVVIGTKLFLNTSEVQRDGSVYGAVRRHLEGSLERLQTDYADLYYLHRMAGGVRIEDVAEAMGQLMEEGLIRGWGLSQVDVDVIDRAQQVTPLSAIQNIYSMVERDKHFLVDSAALVPLGHVVDAVHLLNEDAGLLVQFQHLGAEVVGQQPQALGIQQDGSQPLVI